MKLSLEWTEWQLVRPQVLRGEFVIEQLPEAVRLLVICNDELQRQLPIWQDILMAFALSEKQVYWIQPEQVVRLKNDFHCNHWWLGCKITHALSGACLQSSLLSQLSQQPEEKRALWQQIIQYEHNFYLDRS